MRFIGRRDRISAELVTLIDDPARRRAMGARGRGKAESRYTWEIQYGKLKRLYATLSLPA